LTNNPRASTGTAAALLLTGSLVGWAAAGTGVGSVTAEPVTGTTPTVERLENGASASYAPIVDRVTPAVVTIRSERTVRASAPQVPDHPLFREFFGERFDPRNMPERRQGGMGSGVIVRGDGYILTNDHVVNGADEVTVELTDGRSLKAKVVGTDRPSDLAVLKVDGTNLPTLTLGDSDDVRVGDVVLAVGNPLGIGQTVTMGIVSAKGRATGLGDGSYEDFIQTDAPINRGNSGGALVNTEGALIGINSQIVSPSGGNIGIGFAIPAKMAANVMTQLIEHGEVRRGRLGVTIQQVTPDLARGLGLSSASGALVSGVDGGGPAAAAGLLRGDVITALNGKQVRDSNVLRNEIAALQPGTTVTLTVLRDGSERTITAKLAALEATDGREGGQSSSESGRFGLTVEPLTPERARQLGVAAQTGVVVAEVEPGSRAARAGLRPGDVIQQVDRRDVGDGEALRRALENGDRPAVLLVHRGETSIFVSLERTR
jgi:Do/DeqQ family serine protease